VPFSSCGVNNRAYAAWRRAGLDRITLHECRHTFASLAIDAGVSAKALSEFMGHASVAFTWDRYGHLMPGNEKEPSDLFGAYLRGAQGA
jgi:integrase